MKKVKSLKDLSKLMEKLGATKEMEPGFTSWTLHCGPDREKRQAALNLKNAKKRSKQNHRGPKRPRQNAGGFL